MKWSRVRHRLRSSSRTNDKRYLSASSASSTSTDVGQTNIALTAVSVRSSVVFYLLLSALNLRLRIRIVWFGRWTFISRCSEPGLQSLCHLCLRQHTGGVRLRASSQNCYRAPGKSVLYTWERPRECMHDVKRTHLLGCLLAPLVKNRVKNFDP